LEEAQRYIRLAIDLDPMEPTCHLKYGQFLHMDIGDTLGAERCYKRALEIDSNMAIARNEYGVLLFELGR
jgi:Tfp pilus assembly protein PilF